MPLESLNERTENAVTWSNTYVSGIKYILTELKPLRHAYSLRINL